MARQEQAQMPLQRLAAYTGTALHIIHEDSRLRTPHWQRAAAGLMGRNSYALALSRQRKPYPPQVACGVRHARPFFELRGGGQLDPGCEAYPSLNCSPLHAMLRPATTVL